MNQKKFLHYKIFVVMVGIFILLLFLLCSQKQPAEPEKPCINDQPVEDTTRIYLRNVVDVDGTVIQVDTLAIYPPAVFARFYPWVKDTTKIRQLAEKHHLRLWMPPSSEGQQLTAVLCVTDNRRAEYHFTPYGKEGFCNFGADSLVEYAFGVFEDGWISISGDIVFKFVDGTPQTRIDSLFDANGLRFLWTTPDYPTGKHYWTLVTPRSKKNVLDLGNELHFLPFVVWADVVLGTGGLRINCDE